MDEIPTLEQLVETIAGACERLVDDFERLRVPLARLHPDWSRSDLAGSLMEFGRRQISGVDEPTQAEIGLISRYVGALQVPGETAHLFCAYASGCVMGWMATGELPEEHLADALEVVHHSATRIYPEDHG